MAELCEACGGSGLTSEANPKVCKVCTGVGRLGAKPEPPASTSESEAGEPAAE